MKQLKSFGAFWYDFIIGDDWHVAALVAAGLALTAILAHAAKVNAWWLLPVVRLRRPRLVPAPRHRLPQVKSHRRVKSSRHSSIRTGACCALSVPCPA